LQEHEEQKQKKSKRVFGDGMPKLLDSDEFFARVTEHETEVEREAAERGERQAHRAVHAMALAHRKTLEMERKAQNNQHCITHQEAMKPWEDECDTAKREGYQAQLPRLKQGALEKPIPRPKKPENGQWRGRRRW
jgi:hypothetical protein